MDFSGLPLTFIIASLILQFKYPSNAVRVGCVLSCQHAASHQVSCVKIRLPPTKTGQIGSQPVGSSFISRKNLRLQKHTHLVIPSNVRRIDRIITCVNRVKLDNMGTEKAVHISSMLAAVGERDSTPFPERLPG